MDDFSAMSFPLQYHFDKCVIERSSATAVIFQDGHVDTRLSYLQVSQHAQQLSVMIRRTGILEGTTVVSLCRCSAYVPSIILGILRAACAFTFLDVEHQEEGIQNLRNSTSVSLILAEKALFEESPLSKNEDWETVDEFWDGAYVLLAESHGSLADNERARPASEHQIAYVMQTSGTTGSPKTVQVPHQCIVPNILHLRTILSVSPKDVIFQAAPLTFDPFVVEVFLALTSGATLVITSEVVKRIPRAVIQLIVENKVTIIQATPSFISRLGTERIKESLLSTDTFLRVLAFGGEECPSIAQLRSWSGRGNATEFYNLYGITEVSCWATCQRVHLMDSGSVFLGDALDRTVLEVRNESGDVIDEGEGTLFIGGTDRRCLIGPETWQQVGRCQMRNSGDLVHKSSGNLTFLGRCDSVFKYHGHKINSALLSRVLHSSAAVDSCHAHFSKSEGTLFFFVSLSPNYNAEEMLPLLKTDLEKECKCPFHIVVVHHTLPVTSHAGKLDVKTLLRYARKRRRTGQKRPDDSIGSTTCRRLLVRLWNDLTRNDKDGTIPAQSSFILSGGSSLSAVRLAQELEFAVDHQLPLLIDKLLNETFADVVAYLDESVEKQGTSSQNFEETEHSSERATACKNSTVVLSRVGSVRTAPCFSSISRLDSWHQCVCAQNCGREESAGTGGSVTKLELKWKHDLIKCIDASPLIVNYKSGDSVVLVGSHSGLFCAVDALSGNCCWELQVPDRIESSACLSKCGSYVAFGCYDHNIYCVEVASGEQRWSFATNGEVKCSPTLNKKDGSLLCGSHDKHLYCINFETSTLLWKLRPSDGSIFASPAVSYSPDQVYAASLVGTVVCIDPGNGKALWKQSVGKPVFSSPAVSECGLCVCSVGGKVYLMDFFSGNMLWIASTDGPIFSSPVFVKGEQPSIVIGCHDSDVYLISARDGTLRWRLRLDSRVYATVFHFAEAGMFIAATTNGALHLINDKEGTLSSSYRFGGNVFSSPLVLGNCVVVGCRDNFLYCLGLS
ncbi:unnamed protein product [Ixodes hexagonus]